MSIEEESQAPGSPEDLEYSLIIDSRETELIKCIKDLNNSVKFDTKNLDVGDIHITYKNDSTGGIAMCIESNS